MPEELLLLRKLQRSKKAPIEVKRTEPNLCFEDIYKARATPAELMAAYLPGDLLGAARSVGVGLLGDPLAALVGVGEGVPRLLVEVGVAPCRARLRLVVHLYPALRWLLPQPPTASARDVLVHLAPPRSAVRAEQNRKT